ncbi:acyl-CoA--6-aminopenicillanic acid acyltransferase [Aquamicrobium sp. LC103]|nr:acyl-CoA--6-aminopenicillanic acid acyltransferase [Aquamicrobium sp. LC103]
MLLSGRIRRSAEFYAGSLDQLGLPAERKLALIHGYADRIGEFDETYVEEMQGIAEGSGAAFEDIVMINARTEIVAAARAELDKPEPEEPDDGCTCALIMPERSATGRLIHGQNWDWRYECAETGIVLRVRQEHGPDFVTFVEAGGLARSGFNASGTSITANYLECERDFTQQGVPLGAIRRKVLQNEHFARAIKAVATTPKSCSNNIMIATSAGFGIDFECAPDEAFPIFPENGLLVHANHWVSPVALAKLRDTGIPWVPESYYRDWRVRRLLEAGGEALARADLKAAFFDDFLTPYSVCRPPRENETSNISTTVAMIVIDASEGFMEVAALPALNREFLTYVLDDAKALPADAGARATSRQVGD